MVVIWKRLMIWVNFSTMAMNSRRRLFNFKRRQQGSPESLFSLGVMYYQGQEVMKDELKTVALWQEAADRGHAQAQFNLGMFIFFLI